METHTQSTIIDSDSDEISTWALLEVFGHTKVAGRLTTRKLGTEVMFQVDVPKGDCEFSHSELYSPKSIFAIKPTTETWCRRWAKAAVTYQRDVLPYIPSEPAQLAEPAAEEEPFEPSEEP